MIKNKSVLFLGLILLIGVFLRFIILGSVPGSLNWDEVSWGYNAYSISETARDEYGKLLPLSFKAFGDFKQPVYIYLDAFFVKAFGLNAFSVRFASAFFGSLSILLVYFMVKEIFIKRVEREKLALLSAFFFAISPWSIQFSRVAYEANLGLFFVILGVFIFFKGLNSRKYWLLFLSVVPFTISGFTYHSLKIFMPIFFISLIIYSLKKATAKKILALLLIFYIALNLIWVLDSRTTSRGRSVTFFQEPSKILEIPIKELDSDKISHDYLGVLIHNRRVVFVNTYISNYLMHFDPSYLFMKGDNPRHHAPEMGLLYLVSLPFILLGMYFFVKNKISESVVIFIWLLLAPVASSLAVEAPNASRSLIFLPTWDIFFAAGIVFSEKIIAKKYLIYFRIIFWGFLFINFLYFTHQYFIHTNQLTQKDWQYGYKEAVEFVENASAESPDGKIIFSPDIEQGYAFYLFYSKYSPSEYIKEGGSDRMSSACYSIKNSYFGDCKNNAKAGDLFVTSRETQNINEHGLQSLNVIKFDNGSPAVIIYKVN